MPEKCYGGGYVKDIAQGIIDRDGNKWESASDQERMEAFREIAYQEMLDLLSRNSHRFWYHVRYLV